MKHKKFAIKYILLLVTVIYVVTGCKISKPISIPGQSVKMYPIGKDGIWGYANEYGEIKIEYEFEEAKFFTSGLAGVKKDGKFGFINYLGQFEIKPKFDSVDVFGFDRANVYRNGQSYWINRKGKKLKVKSGKIYGVCGSTIKEVSNPNNYFDRKGNRYLLKTDQLKKQQKYDPSANYKIEDFTFEKVIPFTSRSIIVKRNNKFGIFVHYNWVGLKEVWADELISIYIGKDAKGKLYEARNAKIRIGNKWGLISDFGKILIEPEFYSLKESKGS